MKDILGRVVERVALDGHDGRSGAHLERVRLDDGRRLVVKTTSPDTDLAMVATGDNSGRELALWEAGVLDRLPPPVGHCIVAARRDGDGRIVTVMDDLGEAVGRWDRPLGRPTCRRVFQAVAAMHRHFLGAPPAGLCPLERYLVVLSPGVIAAVAPATHPLRAAVLRGWERFAEVVPDEIAAEVAAVHGDAALLAAVLRQEGTTLAHGDLWPVNLALPPRAPVVLLDWGMSVDGPGVMDLAAFLARISQTGAATGPAASPSLRSCSVTPPSATPAGTSSPRTASGSCGWRWPTPSWRPWRA